MGWYLSEREGQGLEPEPNGTAVIFILLRENCKISQLSLISVQYLAYQEDLGMYKYKVTWFIGGRKPKTVP